MSSPNNPSAREQRLKALKEGLQSQFPKGTEVLRVKGVDVPVSTFIEADARYIALYKTAEDAHRALNVAVEARDKAEPEIDLWLEDVESGVVSALGKRNPNLAVFGFPPKKDRKELTTEELADRNEKAKLTRKLRHTMGKRQKKALKAGNQPKPEKPANPSTTENNGAAGK